MIDLNINTKVLVIGGGTSGIFSAYKVAKQGYPVWLLDQNQGIGFEPCYTAEVEGYFDDVLAEVKRDGNIKIVENSRIKRVKGTAGDYKVLIDIEGKSVEVSFGAIIAATPYELKPIFEEFGLTPSSNIFSLGDVEKLLNESSDVSGKIFVFLTTFEGESNPVSFRRILKDAIGLRNLNARVYIITKNVKAASSGLEKLILQAKEKGVFIIKSEDKPQVDLDGSDINISVTDTIVGEKIKILSDVVVVEDKICSNSANQELASLLKIHSDLCGFLQANNVRRVPVFTNRKGIFVVGSAVGIKPFYYVLLDATNAAFEVEALLGNGGKKRIEETISIDRDKCVRCLTCYRVCPHGAISWCKDRIIISSFACEGCGICAAECPMNAIQLKQYSDDDIKKQLYEAISFTKEKPLVIGFCCQNSAYEATKGAEKLGLGLPDGFKVVKVPCAGKVDVDYLLEALVKGADAVVIGACHNGNCKSEKGNIFAGYRVENLKKLFDDIGVGSDKVEVVNVASNMSMDFVLKINEMFQRIER